MKRAKMVAVAVVAVLLIIIIVQNTQAVPTHLLFWTVSLPLVVLLFVVGLVGVALGLLAASKWVRKPQPPKK